jgi:hypothetical protein
MPFWKKPRVKELLPHPVGAAHAEYSLILSTHDDPHPPTRSLIETSLAAIRAALDIDLSPLADRLPSPPFYPQIWPGEHYRLLAGFVQILKPRLIVEIGTATGLSALALTHASAGRLATFDLFPWEAHPKTVLRPSDFANGRLTHYVADLSDPVQFERYRPLLQEAEFFFIDATHDGELESRLVSLLATVSFPAPPLLFFDDIRVWSMLKFWRELPLPKLDLTSFGHWSGSGVAQFSD